MNDLSWLIYFGSISGSLSGFFLFLAIISCIALALSYVGGCVAISQGNDDGKILKNVALKLALPMFLVSSILTCALPSKETVYMIAASEAGEEVIKSPTGKRAVDAINRYLDDIAVPEPAPRR